MTEHPLETIFRLDPPLKEFMTMTSEFVYNDGALSTKFKLLIALAFDAAHGAETGVRSHAQQAVNAGATRQEIVEALRLAYHLSGAGSAYVASRGLTGVDFE
jgi:AhpD family alkylhydroperoxidase